MGIQNFTAPFPMLQWYSASSKWIVHRRDVPYKTRGQHGNTAFHSGTLLPLILSETISFISCISLFSNKGNFLDTS